MLFKAGGSCSWKTSGMSGNCPAGNWSCARILLTEDVLGATRPLPPDEDVAIRELSEEEDRLFLGAILDS